MVCSLVDFFFFFFFFFFFSPKDMDLPSCLSCGEVVKPNWKLCPVCGKQLLAEKRAPERPTPPHELFREFELIPPEDVEWGEVLGEGSYGVVYKGKGGREREREREREKKKERI